MAPPITGTGTRPTVSIRLDPALLAEARSLTPNLTRTIEALLMQWVARERRKQGGQPTARRIIRHDRSPTRRR
jgi:hypothetical protein